MRLDKRRDSHLASFPSETTRILRVARRPRRQRADLNYAPAQAGSLCSFAPYTSSPSCRSLHRGRSTISRTDCEEITSLQVHFQITNVSLGEETKNIP
jgi:hypothetical protein